MTRQPELLIIGDLSSALDVELSPRVQPSPATEKG